MSELPAGVVVRDTRQHPVYLVIGTAKTLRQAIPVLVRPSSAVLPGGSTWPCSGWSCSSPYRNCMVERMMGTEGQVDLRFSGHVVQAGNHLNLSAIRTEGEYLWLAGDETATVEGLTLDSAPAPPGGGRPRRLG